jgi:DNA-binding transcriptional LysR family regulator
MSAPVVFGRLHLPALLAELSEQYPELSINLDLTDRFVDLVDEGYDLALRIGALTDSRLIARRLCANKRVLVASKAYVVRCGTPQTIEDLQNHTCVLFTAIERPREWRLIGPDGALTVSVSGVLSSSNGEVVSELVKLGRGVGLGALFSIGEEIHAGALVRVLPQYEFEPTSVFALYPSTRQLSSKVRLMVDALSHRFSGPTPG